MCRLGFCVHACFNTQPPEGGWEDLAMTKKSENGFNTQPPEGGWLIHGINCILKGKVSTHSRPKAAGERKRKTAKYNVVSTHSRPKAAGKSLNLRLGKVMFQHTAARRRLDNHVLNTVTICLFQHTAARRRLAETVIFHAVALRFQHTAARRRLAKPREQLVTHKGSFNTQPPEGGWALTTATTAPSGCFNTQPPEGGWLRNRLFFIQYRLFQHTAARRRLGPLSKALLHQVSQPQFR